MLQMGSCSCAHTLQIEVLLIVVLCESCGWTQGQQLICNRPFDHHWRLKSLVYGGLIKSFRTKYAILATDQGKTSHGHNDVV